MFGYGADSQGNWHHYWENNKYAGAFRKTGVHSAEFEREIILKLDAEGKIKLYPKVESKAPNNVKWMDHGHISVRCIDVEPKKSHNQLWSTQLLTNHCELRWTKPTDNKLYSLQTKQSFIIFYYYYYYIIKCSIVTCLVLMLNQYLWNSWS